MRARIGVILPLAALAVSACDGTGSSATSATGGSGGEATSSGGTGGAAGTATAGSAGSAGSADPFNIDECKLGLAKCAAEAECVDTPQYYDCKCKAGYAGDGATCADIDECQTLLADCDPNAKCSNTPGAYTCACPAGYAGDGKTCDALYLAASAGQYHACAIRTDKTLWCWGLNTSGQAGTGTGDAFFVRPSAAGGATDWVSLSAGAAFTCAVNDSGKILCFGSNSFGQLGDGTVTARVAPTPVSSDVADWSAVDAGSSHTCALRKDGSLHCWGRNNNGQLGDNTTVDKALPTQIGAESWLSVSAGADFTCAVKKDHSLWCWGTGTSRQLGTGLTANSPVPVREKTMATDWASVSAGNAFTCAVKTNGTRHCWGANSVGQGGDTTTATIVDPKQVDMDSDWTRVESGDLAACGLRGGGELWCWGDGSQGQTGQPGKEAPLLAPAQVGAENDWVALTGGLRFACGIRAGGQLSCWGSASRGALGSGYTSDRNDPSPIGDDLDWVRLSVQADDGCAIKNDSSLWCWGRNAFEHLGDGSNVTRVTPVQIGAGKLWSRVALGRTHGCGVAKEAGPYEVYCWGRDGNGELGNGAGANQPLPGLIAATPGNTSPWLELDAGFNHTCAVREDKTLWCWGLNTRGQLGDGTKVAKVSPTQVLPMDVADWKAVAASGEFTCGLRGAGDVWCWGRNDLAQLGLGFASDPMDIAVPNPTKVGSGFVALDAGANHGCAVKSDSTLWCWGRNNSGELGLGNAMTPVLAPTKVGLAPDWVQPFLGQGTHTCALKTSGDLYCWGTGSYGQLALGSLTSFNSPQKVPSAGTWKAASIGSEHSCGIDGDGLLSCWGASNLAQLGSGVPFASAPAAVQNP